VFCCNVLSFGIFTLAVAATLQASSRERPFNTEISAWRGFASLDVMLYSAFASFHVQGLNVNACSSSCCAQGNCSFSCNSGSEGWPCLGGTQPAFCTNHGWPCSGGTQPNKGIGDCMATYCGSSRSSKAWTDSASVTCVSVFVPWSQALPCSVLVPWSRVSLSLGFRIGQYAVSNLYIHCTRAPGASSARTINERHNGRRTEKRLRRRRHLSWHRQAVLHSHPLCYSWA